MYRSIYLFTLTIAFSSVCLSQSVSRVGFDAVGSLVDNVQFGSLHWESASGDPEPDMGDMDNIFGEHNGQATGVKALNFVITTASQYISWDFTTPSAGNYIISTVDGSVSRGGDFFYNAGAGWVFIDSLIYNNSGDDGLNQAYFRLTGLPAGKISFKILGRGQSPFYVSGASIYKPAQVLYQTGVHPRLLFSKSDIAALRQKMTADPVIADYYNALINKWAGAKGFLNTDLTTDGWKRFGTRSAGDRARADEVTTLAIAWVLSGDSAYGKKCVEELVIMAAWPAWARFHFSQLANGGMLAGVALAYDWVHDLMTEAERQAVQAALRREANYIHAKSVNEGMWWVDPKALNNWTGVIHGGLGLTALVVDGADEEAAAWLKESISLCQDFIDFSFNPDGPYYESFMYYHYGMQNILPFFLALKRNKGTDLMTYRDSLFSKTLEWSIYMMEPNRSGRTPFDDDNSPSAISPNVVLGLASYFGNGYGFTSWDMISGSGAVTSFPYKTGGAYLQLPLTLIYYDPTLSKPPLEDLPLSRVWPVAGRASFRSGFADTKSRYFYTQCGIDGTHSHNDQGSFVFSAYGERLVVDNGYEGWFSTMEAHNLILIDGNNPDHVGGKVQHGSVLSYAMSDDIDFVRVSNKAMYDALGDTVSVSTRDFLFIDKKYMLVMDEIAGGSAKHTYHWLLHTDNHNPTDNNGHEVKVLSEGKYQFLARPGSEDSANLDITMAYPSGVSAKADFHQEDGNTQQYPFLRVTSEATGTARFCTVLTPSDAANPAYQAVVNTINNGRSITLPDIVVGYRTSDTGMVSDGVYHADANAFIIQAKSGSMTKAFMVNGTLLGGPDGVIMKSSIPTDAIFRMKDGFARLIISSLEPLTVKVGGLGPSASSTLHHDNNVENVSFDMEDMVVINHSGGSNAKYEIWPGYLKVKPAPYYALAQVYAPVITGNGLYLRLTLNMPMIVGVKIYSREGKLRKNLGARAFAPGRQEAIYQLGVTQPGLPSGQYICLINAGGSPHVFAIMVRR